MQTQDARRRPSYLSLALSVVTTDASLDMRPLLVLGLLYFRRPLELARLRSQLLERLATLPRFAAVVVDRGETVAFEPVTVSSLDLSYHVTELPVDESDPWTPSKLDQFLTSLNTPEHELDHLMDSASSMDLRRFGPEKIGSNHKKPSSNP